MKTMREWGLMTGYRTLVWAGQPLLHLKLRRRGRLESAYLQRIPERFGRYADDAALALAPRPLWLHAVSLGETRAAMPLLAELRQRRPGLPLLLTHSTATGRSAGQALLWQGDQQVWLPWDKPAAVQRFLRRFQPSAGILMETEVWPELVHQCHGAGVPLFLANARLSERSAAAAQRWPSLSRPAYRRLTGAWAQTEADAERLASLGAPVMGVIGNLKFDLQPDPTQWAQGRAWRSRCRRPVALLASSREGEEAVFLAALASHPARSLWQWLIVPRHPQRFDEVAGRARDAGWTVVRRSAWGADGPPDSDEHSLWLGDSMGEMALYYGLAHLALMGGTFCGHGGQNLIEAAACGCPVLLGPSVENFEEAAAAAVSAGAARRVAGLGQALDRAAAWSGGQAGAHAEAARAATGFAAAHRGAAQRLAVELLQRIDPAGLPTNAGTAPVAHWHWQGA